jgi:hypothetical protein
VLQLNLIIDRSLFNSLCVYQTWPASQIWPQVLIDTTILNMLHADEDVQHGKLSRTRFFGLILIGSFLYAFIPGELSGPSE